MQISKQEFIEKQVQKMCRMCSKKARIIDILNRELNENGFLFEMQEKFHEIVAREG